MLKLRQILKQNPISYSVLIFWLLVSFSSFIIEFKAHAIDLGSTLLRPFSIKHCLGTDDLGRDILSCLIVGSQYVWVIGLGVCFFSGVGGILLGTGIALLSYFYKKIPIRYALVGGVLAWLVMIIMIEQTRHPNLWKQLWTLIVVGGLIIFLNKLLGKFTKEDNFMNKPLEIPFPILFNYLISLHGAVPGLVIALIISTFVFSGIISVIIILSLVAWIPFARVSYFVAQHQLRQPYSEAVQVLGIPTWRALWRHFLPGIMPQLITPLMQTFVFSILTEATLSFLGFGLSAEKITWGGMLSSARNIPSAWWLAVFPIAALLSLSAAMLHIAESFDQRDISTKKKY